ncbi:MAG: short-chain dehydrogenase, partial [Gemmatimonadota bacterium]|nr:short-chain dehydrogenase [Gemmatimonadota bacterium]
QQKTDQPDDGRDNLFEASRGTGSTTGEWGRGSMSRSLYTRHVELYPDRKRLLMGMAMAGALMLMRRVGR